MARGSPRCGNFWPYRFLVFERDFSGRGELAQSRNSDHPACFRHDVSEDRFNLRPVGVAFEAAEDEAVSVRDSRR